MVNMSLSSLSGKSLPYQIRSANVSRLDFRPCLLNFTIDDFHHTCAYMINLCFESLHCDMTDAKGNE